MVPLATVDLVLCLYHVSGPDRFFPRVIKYLLNCCENVCTDSRAFVLDDLGKSMRVLFIFEVKLFYRTACQDTCHTSSELVLPHVSLHRSANLFLLRDLDPILPFLLLWQSPSKGLFSLTLSIFSLFLGP